MGGKTSQSTSQVSIPPEVLARYNSVNAQAQNTAGTPFQEYSTDPNAFVAPLNQQQQAGISDINQYANAAQPGYKAAQAGTMAAGAGTGQTIGQLGNISQGYNAPNYQAGVQGYMNPYLQNAMGSTAAMMQNQNQQQQQQLQGNAISQGAFGGDRGNIAQAALMGQQNLAMGQTLGQMANTGYQSAAQNYMSGLGQQGALAGQQGAMYGQLGNLANQYGQLGAGAQTAGLQGAQAQVGAGTLGQQTSQAGLSALYNQFQQQQAYPFQVSQFLANIAEGTGALSGSTTTTTQPQSLFGSDARIKEDIKKVGTADNGLPIYTFKYKGDPQEQTHIGFIAQDVEKVHPEAVAKDQRGIRYVDYAKAAEPAPHHRASGGLAPASMGGHVHAGHAFEHYADGGYAEGMDPLLMQKDMYAPFSAAGIYGHSPSGLPGGKGIVPPASLSVGHLMTANAPQMQQHNDLQTLAGDVGAGKDLYKDYQFAKGLFNKPEDKPTDLSQYPAAPAGTPMPPTRPADLNTGSDFSSVASPEYRGGIVHGYASGGDIPYGSDDPLEEVVQSGEKTPDSLKTAQTPSQSGGSGLGNLTSIVGLGKDAMALAPGIGTAMSGIGSAAAAAAGSIGDALSAFPFLFLSTGGIAGREHHNGSDGNVVGDQTADQTADQTTDQTPDQDSLDGKMQYKIAPQSVNDMDPAQQQVVKTIYGGESGGKYNILNGGEEFDPSNGHPHRVGKGGESTAAGAGQFIGSTWDNVTGGAPMTPEYQDAATWQLANDDYRKRTGRDLKADVSENGFTPEIKAALAPTWTSLGEGKPSKQAGDQAPSSPPTPSGGIAGGQDGQSSIWDKLTSEQVLLPLLSGLGTMASSNSRYLLPAVLQGIGGGAQTYMQLQKQESEIAKNTLGLAAQRFTPIGNGEFFDRTRGDTIPLAEYQNRLAQMPGMSKYMGMAGAKQPSAGIAAPTAPAAPAASNIAAPTAAPATPAGIAAKPAAVTPVATTSPADQAATQAAETAKTVTPQPTTAAGQQPAQQPAQQPDIVSAALSQAESNPQVSDLRKQAQQWQSSIPTLQAQLNNATDQARYIPGMNAQATKLQAQLQYAREQYNSYTTRADALRTQIAQPTIDNAKAAATAEATEAAKLRYGPQQAQAELQAKVLTPELYKANIATRTNAYNEAISANEAINQSKQMMDLMFDPQTQQAVINGGPLGETLANSGAILKQAGFSDGFINLFTGTDPAKAGALDKLRTAMGTEIARQDLGPGNQVRQQEFLRFLNSTPGTQMLPEAFKFINETMIQPKAQVAKGAYEKIAALDPAKDDLQNAYYSYQRDNAWYHPKTAAPAQGGSQPAAAPQQVTPDIQAAARAELARRKALQGAQ